MIGVRAAADVRVLSARLSGAVVPLLVLATLAAVTVTALDVPARSFRSPDEHINYQFTRTFAETGKLYYTNEYLPRDDENLLHPRGALTLDGKAVPFKYFGLPVLYAPAYLVLGEHVRYIGIPLALLTIGALAAAGSLLIPRRPWLAWIATLGATPIVYYVNRPFLNTLPAMAALSVGIYVFLRYYRDRTPGAWVWLVGGSAAFAIAAFARYEFIIFETLFLAVFLLHRHGSRLRPALRDMAVYLGIVAALFVVPVLVLNQLTYGSPFTFGYGLLNDAYFPGRSGAEPFLGNLMTVARSILLPAYPFDLGIAGNAFAFQVIGVAPFFLLLALFGAVAVLRTKAVPLAYTAAYAGLGVYVFLYRGAGYSWLADSSTPNLEASVVRYVLPLYAAFYLLGVVALARVGSAQVAGALVAIIALLGVLGALRDVDGSLLHIRTQVRVGHEQTMSAVVRNTEPSAIVYTDVFDKTIGPYRDVAAWWGGVRGTHEGFFRPDEVAYSMYKVSSIRPVYLFVFEEEFVVPRLEDALEPWGLTVVGMDARRLYRIERDPDTEALR